MSSATQLREEPVANSIHKRPSPFVRVLPALVACIPKLGCPLCWPALAALCSLCGVPCAALNPLLIGVTLLVIVLLLITALSRHSFSLSSGLLLVGLIANLGARLWAAPVWIGYVVAVLVLTALFVEFLLPAHFVRNTPSSHCMHSRCIRSAPLTGGSLNAVSASSMVSANKISVNSIESVQILREHSQRVSGVTSNWEIQQIKLRVVAWMKK
jgi:hypothetical protein